MGFDSLPRGGGSKRCHRGFDSLPSGAAKKREQDRKGHGMRTTKMASALLGLLATAGCSSFSERWSEKMDDPMSLPRMLMAGTNVPPGTQTPGGAVIQPGATSVVLASPEDAYCPPIGVPEGGAVIQVGGR